MNIIKEIGGLDRSMKKKAEKLNEAETIAIVSDEEISETTPKKIHFWSRRPKDGESKRHRLEANELSSGAKKSMATRLISAAVGLAIVVPAIVLGQWIYFIVISVALLIACYEVLGCTSKRTIITVLVYFIFVAAIAYWPIFKSLVPNIPGDPWEPKLVNISYLYMQITLPILIIVIGSFLVFFLTVIYKDFTVHDACYLITMAIIVGLGFQCLFFLRYYPNNFVVPVFEDWTFNVANTINPSLLLVFVIFSTFMTDTGAYFVGIFFGKRKMNERISPKKTWEGFVGGVVISFLLSSALGLTLSGTGYPIHPAFLLKNGWYLVLILSAIIPLFATLGDFVFSSIKRYWGIKDYGKLIPGHGGVLDRLDSIIFAVIVTSIFVHMIACITDKGFNWTEFLV